MTEILKLITDGGAAVAVVVVVMLFLKNQRTMTTALAKVADRFTEEVGKLSKQHDDAEKEARLELRALIGEYTDVSKETSLAVRQLEAAVRELRDEVRSRKS